MRRLVIVVLIAACTKPNPNVCCLDEADCNAKKIPVGSTCEPGLLCRGNQCIAQPCTSAAQCDPAAPYCVAELCAEACTDDVQCPGSGEPDTERFCVAGDCVQCRASGDCAAEAPVCDRGACRSCQTHDECGSEVCDAGRCIPETEIVYAAPEGSTSSNCQRSTPCTLERALQIAGPGRNHLKLLPGTYSTTDEWQFEGGYHLTVYGPATLTSMFRVLASSSVGAASLRMRDLVIKRAVACSGSDSLAPVPSLELDHVIVAPDPSPTSPPAVTISRCRGLVRDSIVRAPDPFTILFVLSGSDLTNGERTRIERSLLQAFEGPDHRTGRALTITKGASVEMVNSVVRGGFNPMAGYHTGAITFNGASPSSIRFTTFYNTVLNCPDDTGGVILDSQNNIFVNDLVTAPFDVLSGNRCTHRYVLAKPQTSPITGSNNKVNLDPRFVDPANNDFHLLPGSPAIDAADPTATESADFEGTPRPQGAGRDIGAFEYKGM